MNIDISTLVGHTFSKVYLDPDIECIIFEDADGSIYRMEHIQDCCERVSIEDISGNLEDLVDTPILNAYESTNKDNIPHRDEEELWTFYRLSTIKGTVVIRWYGGSNGWYSVDVGIYDVTKENY